MLKISNGIAFVAEDFIDPWLNEPYPDRVEPEKNKIRSKIIKRNRPLQLYGFESFCIEMETVKNAEHGKKMDRHH